MDKNNVIARLENWSFHFRCGEYDPPESRTHHLAGKVYGHKNHERHPDGKEIVTSPIIGVEGNLVLTHSGSKYELGTVDPLYEKEFPNAKERLLRTINSLTK